MESAKLCNPDKVASVSTATPPLLIALPIAEAWLVSATVARGEAPFHRFSQSHSAATMCRTDSRIDGKLLAIVAVNCSSLSFSRTENMRRFAQRL